MGLVQRPTNPKSKGYGNWAGEAPKELVKSHGNVRMRWPKDA